MSRTPASGQAGRRPHTSQDRLFIDGAFWHGHPDHFTFGQSGAYWDAKIARTQEGDRAANDALAANGWFVLWFWDFEVENDLTRVVSEVLEALPATTVSGPKQSRRSQLLRVGRRDHHPASVRRLRQK